MRRLLALLILLPRAAAAEVSFRNVHRMDAEYELDRRMADVPADVRDAFLSAETAYRVSGGSLNIRHFLIAEDLKARFILLDDRFWFRFRHRRRQGLERDDREALLAFEWRVKGPLYLSFVGEPTFHKGDTSAGFAARWGRAEGRSVTATWLWPGFDNNYAYRNRSVSEGRDRFYRRAPSEGRLAASWAGEEFSASAELRAGRGWTAAARDFSTGAVDLEEGASAEGQGEARWRRGDWTWGAEAERWRGRNARRRDAAPLPADVAVRASRGAARAWGEYLWSGRWRGRLGWGYAVHAGRAAYAAAPAADDVYRIVDRIAEASLFRRAGRAEWEMGFLYDRQTWRAGQPGALAGESVSQNRGKAGWRLDFSERAWVKVVGAVELDRGRTEAFFSFDGGTVLLQASF